LAHVSLLPSPLPCLSPLIALTLASLFVPFTDGDTPQDQVFTAAAHDAIVDLFRGFHCTIFAYGQTGAGKSYTMFGPAGGPPTSKGVVPRCINAVFAVIDRFGEGIEYSIGCSFLQVYKEEISDLLDPSRQGLVLRESPAMGVYVDNLSMEYVSTEEDIFNLLKMGEKNKQVASTAMNERSSRSHTCFVLNITQVHLLSTNRLFFSFCTFHFSILFSKLELYSRKSLLQFIIIFVIFSLRAMFFFFFKKKFENIF
jgi:hypothetical protein